MKNITNTLLIVLLYSSFTFAAEDKGFKPIFNGKNLEGWTLMGKAEGWSVKDGILRSEGAKGGDWIRSKEQYGDYILKLDWKVSAGGNSGIFIRATEEGNPWITGYEVQILDAPGRDLQYGTGSLYGYFSPKPMPDHTPDKWHTFEIQCVGSKIKITADGVKILDVDQLTNEKSKSKPVKGYIGLQDSHSKAGHYIEYRNIRIKKLKPAGS